MDGPNIVNHQKLLDYVRQDARFPAYVSSVTISNPDSLYYHSSETGINTGSKELKNT
jgi:hypothetical protein